MMERRAEDGHRMTSSIQHCPQSGAAESPTPGELFINVVLLSLLTHILINYLCIIDSLERPDARKAVVNNYQRNIFTSHVILNPKVQLCYS